MSIATVVTRGYGTFGTVGLVVTSGYNIAIPPVFGNPIKISGIFSRSDVVGTLSKIIITGESQ